MLKVTIIPIVLPICGFLTCGIGQDAGIVCSPSRREKARAIRRHPKHTAKPDETGFRHYSRTAQD